MSNNVNTEWLERAADMIDRFTGKMPAKVIEADLKRNDLDALRKHVIEAEAIAAQQEFHDNDIY